MTIRTRYPAEATHRPDIRRGQPHEPADAPLLLEMRAHQSEHPGIDIASSCKPGGSVMPEEETLKRAREDKRAGKAPTTQAGEFVREEIHHVREGGRIGVRPLLAAR